MMRYGGIHQEDLTQYGMLQFYITYFCLFTCLAPTYNIQRPAVFLDTVARLDFIEVVLSSHDVILHF
jgi:hypothetical protein